MECSRIYHHITVSANASPHEVFFSKNKTTESVVLFFSLLEHLATTKESDSAASTLTLVLVRFANMSCVVRFECMENTIVVDAAVIHHLLEAPLQ